MVFIAFALILLGVFAALLGHNLFRLLLPFVGLFAGIMVGFGGVQGAFGTGAVSTTIAVLMAVIVGVLMMVLSFMFFEIAVLVLSAMVGAAALSYLGVVLTLGDNGFLMFMLALAGAVLGFVFASRHAGLSTSLVIGVTAFAGVSFVLAGVMLLVGDISLDNLNEQGIISSVISVVDQSFLWFLAWFGLSLFAISIQTKSLMLEIMGNSYAYKETK